MPLALARMNGAMSLVRHQLDRTPAPVAPTPATTIASEGAARLLRYARAPGAPQRHPIVLCPSLINRLYVLDLKEGISTVAELSRAGHTVYGIDWGDPGVAERGVGFDGFVVRLQHFLRLSCRDADVRKIHVLGHCLGGTMATALAALDDAHMQTLINLTVPISFHDGGLLSAWSRAPFLDAQLLADVVGHIPPWLTQPAFQVLKPTGKASKLLRLYQSLDKPAFLEFFRCLETWINDNVSIPDAFFVDLNIKFYQRNELVQDRLRLPSFDTPSQGVVQLHNLRIPVLTVAAEHDHIVPLASALAGHERYGSSQKQLEILDGGHIGAVVGGLARRKLWPTLLTWLQQHAPTQGATA